jgi:hypothetical protein
MGAKLEFDISDDTVRNWGHAVLGAIFAFALPRLYRFYRQNKNKQVTMKGIQLFKIIAGTSFMTAIIFVILERLF